MITFFSIMGLINCILSLLNLYFYVKYKMIRSLISFLLTIIGTVYCILKIVCVL